MRSRSLAVGFLLVALGASGCASMWCKDAVSPKMQAEIDEATAFTDASLAAALAAQGLEVVSPPYEEVHSSDLYDNPRPPGEYEFVYMEFESPSAGSLPMFVRDGAGVLHVLRTEREVVQERSYRMCDCSKGYDGGITPGSIHRFYDVGELGPELTVSYQAKVVSLRRRSCPRGPPKA